MFVGEAVGVPRATLGQGEGLLPEGGRDGQRLRLSVVVVHGVPEEEGLQGVRVSPAGVSGGQGGWGGGGV